ncbi:MAG: CpaD family pilus assembly protein [Novosphingobium sp.]
MTMIRFRSATKATGAALALSMGLALAGCGGMPGNRTLESLHQPVVRHNNFVLDLSSGAGGLSLPEQRRLAGWFDAMNLRYGDRVTIDDPLMSEATRNDVSAVAGRYGILVGGEAPVTQGHVDAGMVRVVLTRASATVPGCPDWSANSDANLKNATSSNYGCATNSNLAAMVANPDHLIKGDSTTGQTVIMSSNKAIGSYREQKPTGEKGLKSNSTNGGGN